MASFIEKYGLPQHFPMNLRVLVIDQDINLLNDIEKICFQFHYQVKICSKVSDALLLLRKTNNCFDMILIEAKMSDMNSYEFVQYVTREIKIPVIMMCFDGSTNQVMKSIANGACDYWIKPLNENQIKNMWQHVARKYLNENKKQEIFRENLDVEGSKKIGEEDSIIEDVENDKEKYEPQTEKSRLAWSPELHKKFVNAVTELGADRAVPKKIHELMNVDGLTRAHIASHLQKYRLYLKTENLQKHNRISRKLSESNNSHGYGVSLEAQKHNQNQNVLFKPSLWNPQEYSTTWQQLPSTSNNFMNDVHHQTNSYGGVDINSLMNSSIIQSGTNLLGCNPHHQTSMSSFTTGGALRSSHGALSATIEDNANY